MRKRILIIEPDLVLANIYLKLFQNNKFISKIVGHADSAIRAIDQFKPDIVIMEIQLVEHSGIELLYEIRSYLDLDRVKIIILSNVPNYELKSNYSNIENELKIEEYYYKPETKLSELLFKVNSLIKQFA